MSSPPAPLAHSVTILLFNSSRRSLVLVKQFRPGEGGPVRRVRPRGGERGPCAPRVRTQMWGGVQGKLRPGEAAAMWP